ncbi:helix-turn-helix domain-containing protein [Nocardia sp. CA2R105]|nr:helix-turn-helix domain-containing protein [Nocardia coffeae]
MHRRFSETPERFAAFHPILRTVQTAIAHHANGGTVTTNDSSDDNSTTLPRRQLGQYLKENRLGAGLKLEEVAPLMQWSASKLSRIEAGKSPNVRVVDVEALCRIYDIEDEEVVAGLIGLAKQSAGKSWWQAYDDIISGNFDLYVGMESSAKHIQIFRPDMPSGLFQTAGYAHGVDRVYFPSITEEELARRIELKTKRQALITRKTNPVTIELIIQEGALRTVVSGPDVMRDELLHLANMPINVTVRVLPFEVGFPAGLPTGPFTILDFGQDAKGRDVSPTVVYIESYAGDMYLERAKDVGRYRQAYSVIQQSSLDVASSKRLLRQVAKEFRA